jgi:hypothetical protein
MANEHHPTDHWPVTRIFAQAGEFRIELFYAEQQCEGTEVGAGSYPTFATAFGDALLVANLLSADLIIAKSAAAQIATASSVISAEISQTKLVEGFEP